MKEKSLGRLEQLTFTRFIAAISIVVFHFGQGVYPFNHPYISFIFKHANYAVSYFFMLSGFVMILSYNNKEYVDPLNFIKRRIARIYPVYFIALLFTVLIYLTIYSPNFENIFLNIALLQSWIPNKATTLNYPGWSLSVEFFFYALFPFLFNRFYKRYNLKTLLIIGVLIWLSSQLLFHLLLFVRPGYRSFFFYFPVLHLNEFILGMLAGAVYLRHTLNIRINYNVLIFTFLLLILGIMKFPMNLEYHNGLLAILFIPLIIFLSLSNGAITRFFKKKIFVFLGEISYGIYILQLPVWLFISDYRLFKYLTIPKSSDLGFYVKIACLIGISAISFFLIEKPFQKIINKIKLRSLKFWGVLET